MKKSSTRKKPTHLKYSIGERVYVVRIGTSQPLAPEVYLAKITDIISRNKKEVIYEVDGYNWFVENEIFKTRSEAETRKAEIERSWAQYAQEFQKKFASVLKSSVAKPSRKRTSKV